MTIAGKGRVSQPMCVVRRATDPAFLLKEEILSGSQALMRREYSEARSPIGNSDYRVPCVTTVTETLPTYRQRIYEIVDTVPLNKTTAASLLRTADYSVTETVRLLRSRGFRTGPMNLDNPRIAELVEAYGFEIDPN